MIARPPSMSRRSPFLFLACLLVASAPAFAQDKPDALQLYRANRYEEAIKVCQQELVESPKSIDSHVVMGWSYLRLKRFPEALDIGQKALQINPNDPRVIQIIGEAQVFLGKTDDALKNLEEYVALRPDGDRIARVYWLMGEVYINLKEYQNADISISTALYYEQNNSQWWSRLGWARELAGDWKWASDAYVHALKLDPGLADAQRGKDRVDAKLRGG
ncbi:MAG TPA: tetratricopeptide repeat protein [Spirochaetia bacterium]|nr:tetratricopeptide repeat protein [Spirochaetia bacterium]